ncbi:MAG TPA: hypothetical protein VKT78_01280 [Fimbriimonadaceae bacterium]|nr:hypothetical protein [Fimbriimonadaceae bacterium]
MRYVVPVVLVLALCGCSHQSEIVGKWSSFDNATYVFRRDYTFTFDTGDREAGNGYHWRFKERGTYDFDGSTLTLHIKAVYDGADKPTHLWTTWERYSFEPGEHMAWVASLGDDCTNPPAVAMRKKYPSLVPESVIWLPVPIDLH